MEEGGGMPLDPNNRAQRARSLTSVIAEEERAADVPGNVCPNADAESLLGWPADLLSPTDETEAAPVSFFNQGVNGALFVKRPACSPAP